MLIKHNVFNVASQYWIIFSIIFCECTRIATETTIFENVPIGELKRGNVMGDKKNPPKEVETITATIIILGDNNKMNVGDCLEMECHTAERECKIIDITEEVRVWNTAMPDVDNDSKRKKKLKTMRAPPHDLIQYQHPQSH